MKFFSNSKRLVPALLASLILAVSLIISGCGSRMPAFSTSPATPSMPTSQHVVMVMEENQSYTSTAGNMTAWPHLNALMKAGAQATNYFADAHPSIPDYFMLTTGQTVTFDDSSTQVVNVDNIARRMLDSNVSFKVYAEGITQGYVGGNTGLYVIRHNPFALLSDVASSRQVANQVIQPFTAFPNDVANKTLPAFSFVVPNINDDAHSGTPHSADNWLQSNVIGPLAANPAFQAGGDGLLIVLFDESVKSDITNGGGHVACVFWGPIAKSGYTQASTNAYQHQNMLRTIMEVLGLSNPPGLAAPASDMSEFFILK
jgi:phosphatidylinositol-3-phosphatase